MIRIEEKGETFEGEVRCEKCRVLLGEYRGKPFAIANEEGITMKGNPIILCSSCSSGKEALLIRKKVRKVEP